MLHISVVREIRRLLAEEELSYRAIAEKLGVSRGVVGMIAGGRRGLYGRIGPSRLSITHSTAALPTRCPGCGGLVYLPCRLCRVRFELMIERELPRLLDVPRRVA
jgi:hypothetical protein